MQRQAKQTQAKQTQAKQTQAKQTPTSQRPTHYTPPYRLGAAKKTALKKEHQFTPTEFPSLFETLTHSASAANLESFSSAAKKKNADPVLNKADVEPGWVHIRKHNNKIEYKYGAAVVKADDTAHATLVLGNQLFKYRLAKEQYERDIDLLRLGDCSEYYGTPSLAEIYAKYAEADQTAASHADHPYGCSDEETTSHTYAYNERGE